MRPHWSQVTTVVGRAGGGCGRPPPRAARGGTPRSGCHQSGRPDAPQAGPQRSRSGRTGRSGAAPPPGPGSADELGQLGVDHRVGRGQLGPAGRSAASLEGGPLGGQWRQRGVDRLLLLHDRRARRPRAPSGAGPDGAPRRPWPAGPERPSPGRRTGGPRRALRRAVRAGDLVLERRLAVDQGLALGPRAPGGAVDSAPAAGRALSSWPLGQVGPRCSSWAIACRGPGPLTDARRATGSARCRCPSAVRRHGPLLAVPRCSRRRGAPPSYNRHRGRLAPR